MNSVANFIFRATFRFSPFSNKPVLAYLSQVAGNNAPIKKRKSISKAMRAYIDRVKEFEDKHITDSQEYDTGKRFLANIMGEDPASFSKHDVNRTIEYLLPSGLFQKFSRPVMETPEDSIEAAKFDDTGRPSHFLFYTARPQIYELQYETVSRINKADALLENIHRKGHTPEKENKMDLVTTEWKSKDEMKKMLGAHFKDAMFEKTIETLEALANHPMSAHFKDFVLNYRKPILVQTANMELPKIQEDADGRFFVETTRKRKTATATVIVKTGGTGNLLINGEYNILYFQDVQAREQIAKFLRLRAK